MCEGTRAAAAWRCTAFTGALFLLVGVVYERRHTRLISEYGGLWKQMPIYATIFLVTMFSSIGLPGLNGFVGEFLILMGAFKAIIFDGVASASSFSSTIYMLSAISGVVLGAVYMLWMYQRVMFGPLENEENKKLADLSCREVLVFAPLLVLMVLMGLFPNPFLSRMEKSVDVVVARMAPVHKAYQAKTQERTEKHAVVARTEHTH